MIKINKSQARKMYNEGITITIVPNKIAPDSMWYIGAEYSKDNGDWDFDKLVNEIEVYNCNYEVGYYASYYIKQ